MADYSSYFDFDVPRLQRETKSVSRGVGDQRSTASRYVVGGGGGRGGFEERPGFGARGGGGSDVFDDVMAGLDAESARYSGQLKGLYDKYQSFVSDYEGDIKPIMDEMFADVGKLSGYVDDYASTVGGMEDTFTSGIEVEPSARARRSEYIGAVAGQYDAAEKGVNRNLSSQGINPYGASGAKRKFALDRAGAVAGASNSAYKDWREQKNRDVVAKQQGMAAYARMKGQLPGMYSQVSNARNNIAGIYGNVLNAKIGAQSKKARGYEGLLDRTEQRRSEALALKQNQTNIGIGMASARSKMNTDLVNSGRDRWRM